MVMSRKQVTNSRFIAAFSHVNAFKSNLKLNKSMKMKLKDRGTRGKQHTDRYKRISNNSLEVARFHYPPKTDLYKQVHVFYCFFLFRSP